MKQLEERPSTTTMAASEPRTIAKASDTRLDRIERTVVLTGLTPIMFDRYPGDNSTKLDWWQKVYLRPGSSQLCLPTMNVVSFLSSHNTNSAPKRLRDKRKYKDIANACLSFVMISGMDGGEWIELLRDGRPVEMGDARKFVIATSTGLLTDPLSGLYLHRSVARLDKGIPNPKERPVLPLPWELAFRLTILQNSEIKEQEVRNLFSDGGLAIGMGTFRGVFGKNKITRWD